ncbi:MAG: cyclic lactone autoinducer peptide [Bacillota bacterium]
MLRKILSLSMAVLTFIAFTNAAAACSTLAYQPELPEQLK